MTTNVRSQNYSPTLKYGTLLLITLQTSVLVLTLRYSRKKTNPDESYFNSTAVLLSELLKLGLCTIVLVAQGILDEMVRGDGFLIFFFLSFELVESAFGFFHTVKEEIIGKPVELTKTAIPAFLYTVQNNLLFLALTNLDAATYQVTYQLKIFTTALFSRWILSRHLSIRQWFSLLLLMCGVIMVQWPRENIITRTPTGNRFIGLTAIILSSFSSGFSGVYYEKLIKVPKAQSLWVRNLQLAIFSCLFASIIITWNDSDAIAAKGFFHGYDQLTWFVIVLQAFGGLCVSLVMKYADNILKGFATTISIIISSVCSHYLLGDFEPSFQFYLGTFLVVTSTLMYSL